MLEFNQKTVCEASESDTKKFKAELFLAIFLTISLSVKLDNFIKIYLQQNQGTIFVTYLVDRQRDRIITWIYISFLSTRVWLLPTLLFPPYQIYSIGSLIKRALSWIYITFETLWLYNKDIWITYSRPNNSALYRFKKKFNRFLKCKKFRSFQQI